MVRLGIATSGAQGGDNLYLSSIVAINPDDGSMVWHYQTTPGDNWDYTATQHMILTELEVKGEQRKVIMQAPKNGFFYVLDRETGEFLSAEARSHYLGEPCRSGNGAPRGEPWGGLRGEAALTMPAPYGGHNWHP